MVYVLALLIGVVAGLRSMTAPAAASWAVCCGEASVQGTPVAFMGAAITPWVFTVLAALEMVADQLPRTPSRKTPVPFIGRVLAGALSGATVGAPSGALVGGLVAGAAGGVLGTLGGYEFRKRLAARFGKDRPAAFVEDAVAVVLAVVVACAVAA
jgi:uncharacterized membrane protein